MSQYPDSPRDLESWGLIQSLRKSSELIKSLQNKIFEKVKELSESEADLVKKGAYEVLLAECYLCGFGVAKDKAKGFHYCCLSASRGNAKGQFRLGQCYELGIGVEESRDNPIIAFQNYSLSASQGHPFGMLALGDCYRRNFGVEESLDNPRLALEQYRLSAEAGEPSGQYWYGKSHDEPPPIGVKKSHDNPEIAFQNYLLSANQFNPLALVVLGDCYHYGRGTERNDEKAFEAYCKASALEDPQGLAMHAEFICLGKTGPVNDPGLRVAFDLYRESANQNNPIGQCGVAETYRALGRTSEVKDFPFKNFLLSAAQGFPRGQFRLSQCYWHGEGTKKIAQWQFIWPLKLLPEVLMAKNF